MWIIFVSMCYWACGCQLHSSSYADLLFIKWIDACSACACLPVHKEQYYQNYDH